MKPLSSSSTFFALELYNTGGLLDQCAPLVPSLRLRHIFGTPPRHCCDYKHLKDGNCKNNWTFLLAVDGGGGASEASLVFGGDEEQVERGGRGLRVGGGLVVWGLRAVVGYASATCLAWHLLLLDWKDVVDGESGWARPASLSTKRGVSAAAPQPAGDKTPLLFRCCFLTMGGF